MIIHVIQLTTINHSRPHHIICCDNDMAKVPIKTSISFTKTTLYKPIG